MGDYISGSVYFSGLGNGTDFSNIISQLQKVEEIPKQRLELWRADWQTRYDAFDQMCKTMSSAQTKLSTINTEAKFVKKIATTSDNGVMAATADAAAIDSAHSIEVKQMASNAIWAYNGQFDSKSSVINSTGVPQNFSYTYKGRTRTLSIASGTSLDSFVNIINNDSQNPGVRLSILQSNGKYSFQIQGKDSGANATLTVNSSGLPGMGNGNVWKSTTPIADPDAAIGQAGEKLSASFTTAGVTKSITPLDGSNSYNDLVDAINTAAGTNIASIVGGKLQLNNVDSASITCGKDPETVTDFDGSSTLSSALWTGSKAFADPDVSIANAGDVFSYTLKDGTPETLTMVGGETLNDIVGLINGQHAGTASLDPGNKLVLNDVTAAGMTDSASAVISDFNGTAKLGHTWASTSTALTDTTVLSPDSRDTTFSFTTTNASGKSVNNVITLESGKTVDDLIAAINTKAGPGTASLSGGQLILNGVTAADMKTVSTVAPVTGGSVTNNNWSTQASCDAIFRVDNWPNDMTSSSNSVSDAIPGITISFYDVGKAKISVATDTSSVRENIQTFLDAVNSVLSNIKDLTKVDDSKKTYASNSQFTNEKGSVLTGNYGIQLLKSRLQTTATGSPPGFSKIAGTDLLSGDLIASMAEMGIKVCTEEGNPAYGLFMIAPPGGSQDIQLKDQERFDKAIANNLDAVIDLFACNSKGNSSSPDFRYASHIKGTTKGGSYDVKYDVAADGTIGTVYINGKAAHLDSSMGSAWYTAGTDAGDAAGMAVIIDDLTPGSHSGKISIKQGLVGTMEDFMKGELKEDHYGHNSGAMVILKENYRDIMNNIDKKIDKEQVRLTKWLQTQRLAFSRLETVLGQYDAKQKQVGSQVSQLAKDSG